MSGYSSIYPHVCLSVHLAICSSIPHFSKKSSPIPLLQKKIIQIYFFQIPIFPNSLLKYPLLQKKNSNTRFSKITSQIPRFSKIISQIPVSPKSLLQCQFFQNRYSNAHCSNSHLSRTYFFDFHIICRFLGLWNLTFHQCQAKAKFSWDMQIFVSQDVAST